MIVSLVEDYPNYMIINLDKVSFKNEFHALKHIYIFLKVLESCHAHILVFYLVILATCSHVFMLYLIAHKVFWNFFTYYNSP